VQEANAGALKQQLAVEADQLLESMHEAVTPDCPLVSPDQWLHSIFKTRSSNPEAERAKAAMLDVQDRLGRLSGARP
jgi:hypothetical protein